MKLRRTCPDLVISFPLYANSALLALVIDAGKALEAGTLILHLVIHPIQKSCLQQQLRITTYAYSISEHCPDSNWWNRVNFSSEILVNLVAYSTLKKKN